MKKILLISSILLSMHTYSQEILCLADSTSAPFDEIELVKSKGNKYSVVVKKDDHILVKDELAYVFLRRNQYGRFRNKEQTITIKTKRLYVNQPQRSLLNISILDKVNFPGLCKLY